MIFETGTNNLSLVVEIFRSNKPDHTVHQERIEQASQTISPRFQGELIDSEVSVRRQGASLPCLEVHDVISNPAGAPVPMLFEGVGAALVQHSKSDAKASVRSLRPCHRLE